MKRIIPLFLVLLMLGIMVFVLLDTEPKIVDGTERTAAAIISDRAMSDNLPYIGVQFEDGSALCLWDPRDNVIPDDVSIGDTVEVTYGKQDGFDRYVVLQVTKK